MTPLRLAAETVAFPDDRRRGAGVVVAQLGRTYEARGKRRSGLG